MLHGPGERTQQPQPRLRSGDADVVRGSKLYHAVERVDGDVYLGRAPFVRARAQPVADHLLEPADRRLGSRPGLFNAVVLPCDPWAATGSEGAVAAFSPLLDVLADVPDPRRAQGQLPRHAASKRGFGRSGNDPDLGLFLHPAIAIDAVHGGMISLVGA